MDKALTLEQVDEAITAVMSGGQSYKIGSRSLTRADLSELLSLRKQLQAETVSGADGDALLPGFARGVFSGR